MNRFIVASLAVAGLAAAASAQLTAYGVTFDNRLVSFNPASPGTITGNVAIAGLDMGESVLGIDARPASLTGALVIVTSNNRLLSLDFDGTATPIGAGFAPALSSPALGMDFNPTVDRVRVINSNGENRRLNPVTGAGVAIDAVMTFSDSGTTPFIVGAAYNTFQFGVPQPAGSVRQFVVDGIRNILGETGSQAGGNASFNGGIVTPIGSLGITLTDDTGFDIFGPTQSAFLSVFNVGGATNFYTVDLGTGAATLVGAVGDGLGVRDITVIPTPGAFALLSLAGLASLRRRR
ncbi:MAG: DUF4394 domain-containing protein [Phycisphaerae bacterium]|nr:DUF4394 domain-containing protein [Phycisphaerae bacterium]